MKAVRNIIRKYYKYNYESWTQPLLTSNNTAVTGGTVVTSASQEYNANYAAWRAMDGSWSSGNGDWATATTSGWWSVVYPYTLEITNIDFYGRSTSSAQIYNVSGGTLLGTVSGTNGSFSVNNFKTNSLYITVAGSETVGIIEIVITARKYLGIIESTSSDYDFFEDTELYKLPKKTENNIDKYYGIRSWEKGQYYGN